MKEPHIFESESTTTSTGHNLSSSEWLDSHFLAMQPEYEEMLRNAALQPGWHVLDAGCGNGSFLPLMTELVGADGAITAVDLAPENIKEVNERAQKGEWQAPVSAHTRSVLDLQFEADSFDAIWCANTCQYLSNDEIDRMLNEFLRVLRPRGVLAIKEYEISTQQFQPMPPASTLRLVEALCRSGVQYHCNLLRTPQLPRYMRKAGFVNIQQKQTLMVRNQPLKPVERQLFYDVLQGFSSVAEATDLSESELQAWRAVANLELESSILNHIDFQYRAIQILFLGQVPE